MTTQFQDYILAGSGVGNVWVKLVNNATSTAYFSSAQTTATGRFQTAVAIPAGYYTVFTSTATNLPAAGDPSWVATGDTLYAVSDPFDNSTPVTSTPPSTSAITGYLAAYNYYAGGTSPVPYQIGVGVSRNGSTVQRLMEPAVPTGSGFEATAVKDPWMVVAGGTIYLYYSGFDGSVFKIGLAISTDGGRTWTKSASNPILSPGQAWESVSLEFPTVLYDPLEPNAAKRFKMWYASFTANTGNGVGIGYATSPDGITWTKFTGNPVMAPVAATWEANNQAPGVIMKSGGVYTLFYNGTDAVNGSRDWKVGAVTFSDPQGTYTKAAGNPLLSGDGQDTTVATTVNVNDTNINVANSAPFTKGQAVWLFVLSGGVITGSHYLSHIASIPDGTHITLTDPAPVSISSTGGHLRSTFFNSVWVRGGSHVPFGYRLSLVGFQPFGPDFNTLLGETNGIGYVPDTIGPIVIDYTQGLSVRPTLAESQNNNVSFENAGFVAPAPDNTTKGNWAAYRNAAFSVPSGSDTVIPIDTVTRGRAADFDLTNNWFIAPVGGLYVVSGQLFFDAANAANYQLSLFVNGTKKFNLSSITAGASTNPGPSGSAVLVLAAGDHVQISSFQGSGSSQPLHIQANVSNYINITGPL